MTPQVIARRRVVYVVEALTKRLNVSMERAEYDCHVVMTDKRVA
jgi:hypothetical protein